MLYTLSPKLGPEDLKAINALEQELAMPLLAFSGYNLQPNDITPAQTTRIQELEKRLGMSLVAVKP